jgi:hypothetical protein
MKLNRVCRPVAFFLAVTAVTFASGRCAQAAVKVACVGEQSTHSGHPAAGAGHEWPDELGTVLGAAYTVENDGDNTNSSVLMDDSGATPMPYAGASYTSGTVYYPRSLLSPDIVVIGPWGMHDEKTQTGKGLPATQARFQTDYDFLVNKYLNLANHPKVILTTPLLLPIGGNVTQATRDYITSAILPAVKAVATAHNLTLIDLYTIVSAAPATPALLASDGGVNLAGTQKIAALVAAAIGSQPAGDGGVGSDGGSSKDAGAGGTSGAAGSGAGTAGSTGTAGTAGTTTGTAGTTGTTGTAGTVGTTTGTAGTVGTTAGTAGTVGTTAGTAGTSGATGAAGTTGSTTGAAGSTSTGGARQSSGGCSVASGRQAPGCLGCLLALAIAGVVARRRCRPRR